MGTVGKALVEGLAQRGVDTVFGIPGVHTIELYRGLAGSALRHVTPRHEQGAGFMAEGHARATGRPGVAFVITGPGLTNILTPMAQARSESMPMVVVSSTLARADLGRGRGALHELPDQRRTVESVALWSHTLLDPAHLPKLWTAPGPRRRRAARAPHTLRFPSTFSAPPARPFAPRTRARTTRARPATLAQAAARLSEAARP
jgi:acetolactate synthase-1/2/3 large subunit